MIKQQDNSKYTHKKSFKCHLNQKHSVLQGLTYFRLIRAHRASINSKSAFNRYS